VLAVQLDLVDAVPEGIELDMDDYKLTVSVTKA
jgi:hypothetical protein